MDKDPVYKCKKCKDTGIIKYMKVEWAMYRWQPWLTRDCTCKSK